MPEQRVQTIKIVWQGDGAKKKVVEMTRALSDTDKAVQALTDAFGDSATVTAKVTKTQRELAAEARRVVREQERQNAELKRQREAADNYIGALKHQVKMTSLTVDEQEQYAAQLRLGTKATLEQKRQVRELTAELQRQRTATSRAGGSMRNMRDIAQNLGWQLQDTAVQLQMGTSAMVVLSQQGSQFAAAFGPTGAVVGAVIAVAGALAGTLLPQIFATAEGLEDLRKEMQGLSDEDLSTLEGRLKALAIQDINKAIIAKQEELDVTKKLIQSEKDAFDQSQITAKENLKSQDARIRAIAQATLLGGDKAHNETLVEQNALLAKQEQEMEKLVARSRELREGPQFVTADTLGLTGITKEEIEAQNRLMKQEWKEIQSQLNRRKKAFQSETALLTKQTETLEQEYSRRKNTIDQYVNDVGKVDKDAARAYQLLEQWKTDELKKESDKREQALQKEMRNEVRERDRTNRTLAQLERQVTGGVGDPVAQEQMRHNQVMAQLEEQRRRAKVTDLNTHKRINRLELTEEQNYSKALEEADRARASIALNATNMVAMSMSTTVDLLTTGVQQIREQTAEMSNVQKAMFFFMQSVSAAQALINGIAMGTELAKAAALYDWTGVSSQAWIATGTAIGAAQAGAIMGTTIAGTFDNGGQIPAGQVGIAAEYGDELINGVLVKGPANVTSREQTARIMDREAGQGGNTIINIYQDNKMLGNNEIASITRIAARQGAQEGYNKVKKDFDQGRGIRQTLQKSIGV